MGHLVAMTRYHNMIKRFLTLLPVVILLTGCQTLFGHHDGVIPVKQQGVIQDIQYHVQLGSQAQIGQLPNGPMAQGSRPNKSDQIVGHIGGVAIANTHSSAQPDTGTMYIVKLDSGALRTVVVPSDEPLLCLGDVVYLEDKDDPILTLDKAYYHGKEESRTSCLKNANDEQEDE